MKFVSKQNKDDLAKMEDQHHKKNFVLIENKTKEPYALQEVNSVAG